MRLEDEQGYPWTASTPLAWIAMLGAFSGGVGFWLLAVYLSIWIRSRGRSWLPLAAFGSLAIMSFVGWAFANSSRNPTIDDACGWYLPIAYLVGLYSLRHQLIADAKRQGFYMKINPFLTFCFSVIYLNYCLNPVRFEHSGSAPISLNLANGDRLRK